MEGASPTLLKLCLFQLSGRCIPHDDATPSFKSNLSSHILELSNEVSFVSYFQAVFKKVKDVILPKSGVYNNLHPTTV